MPRIIPTPPGIIGGERFGVEVHLGCLAAIA
jgi:hypothetical protein